MLQFEIEDFRLVLEVVRINVLSWAYPVLLIPDPHELLNNVWLNLMPIVTSAMEYRSIIVEILSIKELAVVIISRFILC